MRNLVFFADGTWNDNDNPTRLTNVNLLWKMSQSIGAENAPQITKYQPGVGATGSAFAQLKGGGFGKGLDDKIIDAYRWLAENYRPSDRIFLFGFSRGAYTVRSLVGMINHAELLDLSSEDLSISSRRELAEVAFSSYRDRGADKSHLDAIKHHPRPDIHFLGCWDTVGALGIPDDVNIIRKLSKPQKYSFNDTRLSENVVVARHAVSIDEVRRAYAPTLWEETEEPASRDMVQKWFPGVHANVGGGYANRDLSDAALIWMAEEAAAAGLLIKSDHEVSLNPRPLGELHDSHTGLFGKLKSRPRSVPNFHGDDAVTAFSEGAIARHRANQGYWPTTMLAPGESTLVAISAEEQWARTNVYLEPGQYRFVAEGKWKDAKVPHGPKGAKEAALQLGHKVGNFWAGLEQRVAGNPAEPSTYSPARRFGDAPWFALVGVIANGSGVDQAKQAVVEHMTFEIGEQAEKPVTAGGYLYCYANDAWKFYFNNSGSLMLTIQRIS
ncbi:MAG: DUF2235 domain-containing protein [Pseudomonadota bacterium]